MLHRIGLAMQGENAGKLAGEVEVNERQARHLCATHKLGETQN
jgi:hypothetical protein